MSEPTKTMHFDSDVLLILSSMRFEQSGRAFVGILTCGQLERKLYDRTNKALEALGGKWNRKAGGHIFAADPRPQWAGVVDNGSLTIERDGFFGTPRPVVLQMLGLAPLPRWSQIVLEPSAGKGAILDVLLEGNVNHHLFHACEKNESRREYLAQKYGKRVKLVGSDFLVYELPRYSDGEIMHHYDRIYANPPFEVGQDIDHVRHMYDLLCEGGALVSVMSEHAFFANDHKSIEFRYWLAEMGGESIPLPDKSFHESGTDVSTRLVCIQRREG